MNFTQSPIFKYVVVGAIILFITVCCYEQRENTNLKGSLTSSILANAQKVDSFDFKKKYVLRNFTDFDWDTVYTMESTGYDEEMIKAQLDLSGLKNAYSIGLKSFPNSVHNFLLLFAKDRKIINWVQWDLEGGNALMEIEFPCCNFDEYTHYGKYTKETAIFYILERVEDERYTLLSDSCLIEDQSYWLKQ